MNKRTEKMELIDIDKLIPNKRNARIHSASQIEKIQASLREFGFVNPVLIDSDYGIIAGHGRVEAAKREGIEKVPCVWVEHLTEEQKRAYILADNRLTELGEWNTDLLATELKDLSEIGFDIDLMGFNAEDFEGAFDDVEAFEDEFEPELPKEPKTRLGEIYQLGRHRLMCGDSTDDQSVKKLMGGVEADLFLTDPPYNVDYEGKTADALKIENDRQSDDDYRKFLIDAFLSANENIKEGAAFYIFHADSEGYTVRGACQDAGWKVRQCLIWNKNSIVMGRQDYHWKHEPCIYGWKDGASHYFIDDRKQSTVFEDGKSININALKKDEMKKLLIDIFSDKISTTVINEDRPTRNAEHPTMKPIKLMGRLIKNSSRQEELVLDTFGGSGSTLIACEQLNRTCYMMELDPKYCDVIIDRWEQFTGKKAKLIKGM